MIPTRKYLSAQGLYRIIYDQFKKVSIPRELAPRSNLITLADCLMSGLALFSLKFPSLLKFDESCEEERIKNNLQTLFHVNQTPSDTYMRERCDEVDPKEVRKIYKKIFAYVQRGKGLETFSYLDEHYLLAGDGTGFFASKSVHCKNCCVKHHKKCHIKFISRLLLESVSLYKKNTYLLVKQPIQGWEIYYIDHKKQKIKIEMERILGLQEILLNKAKKDLSKEAKALVKEKIGSMWNRVGNQI